ncbi:uncharacterized protein LOC110348179 [Heterocephalus glaber]|uniref:Uncharacterized protein LOC110348179 n=1 Tax=Heterocephalus glaber TaxID=10181 RepID=A0AAX6SM69_HETGA|nr:uncharacterized protein LOC110348179 [Heterocephalus glaber]
MKSLISKLNPLVGLELGTPWLSGEAGSPALSAQALKEMALGTKSIARIAASRRSKAQDREGSSSGSSRHLLEEAGLDSRDPKPSATPAPSPADRRWLPARKVRRKRSPSVTCSMRPVTEKPPLSVEHLSESQLPPGHFQPSKSSGKSFFPAVPAASKIKPTLSFHTDEATLHVPEVSFTFPSPTWQNGAGPIRAALLPRDLRGSADSGGQHRSPLRPSNPVGARVAMPRGHGDRDGWWLVEQASRGPGADPVPRLDGRGAMARAHGAALTPPQGRLTS